MEAGWEGGTNHLVYSLFPSQAPQELVSLFSGSRQVVYGYVPNCNQATLKAKIGSKAVETMVSTSDLATTKGQVNN